MSRKRIKVAIVGCGHVGITEHVPAVRAAGGHVLALVDPVEDLAEATARRLKVPHAFHSLGDLFASVSPDVVAICTPPAAHREIALAALRSGKHVFMEKPPTLRGSHIDEVRSAAARAGCFVLAGSHHPYRENVTCLRDRIAAGELGEIYAIDCFKLRRDNAPIDTGNARRPGGVASGSSIHRIDVALFLLGNPEVASVTARTYNHFVRQKSENAGVAHPSGLVEDSVVAQVQFRNGCTLTLRDFHAAHMAEPNDMQCWFGDLTVFGTKAGAQLHPLTLYRNQADGTQQIEVPAVNNDLHQGHRPAYEYLFRCIRENTKPADAPERAVRAMRIIDAIYASAAEDGHQIRFD